MKDLDSNGKAAAIREGVNDAMEEDKISNDNNDFML